MHITVRVKGESVEAVEKQMHRANVDVKQVQLLQKIILSDKLPKIYCFFLTILLQMYSGVTKSNKAVLKLIEICYPNALWWCLTPSILNPRMNFALTWTDQGFSLRKPITPFISQRMALT